MQCFEESQPVKWSYCINTTVGSQSRDLIYHFHGRNGDATWWNDETYYSGEVVKAWRLKKRAAPKVVSVSFGDIWLLTERKDQPDGGLLPFFVQHVLKSVESKLGHPIERRMLVGESMGGINALMVAFKTGNTFVKVASLCPPLPMVSPHASWRDRFDYFRRSGMAWVRILMMLYFSGRFYPDEATWVDNDPVHASSRYDPKLSPKLYLSCGVKDDWGCMEGSKAVVASVRSKGGQIEWHERPGGHCDIDTASLADFL